MVVLTKKITLEEILENSPEELEVPEYGTVLVRMPTNKDKLEARKESNNATEDLLQVEKNLEFAKFLSLKMLVEPKISKEEYLASNSLVTETILDTIWMWYSLRLKKLNDKRKDQVASFLEQMKVNSP